MFKRLGVVLGLSPVAAMAALPTGVDTAFTAVQTDAAAVLAIAAPVVLAVLGMSLVIKLIKRFGNKI